MDKKPKKKYDPKLAVNTDFGGLLKVMVSAKPKEPKTPTKGEKKVKK